MGVLKCTEIEQNALHYYSAALKSSQGRLLRSSSVVYSPSSTEDLRSGRLMGAFERRGDSFTDILYYNCRFIYL